MQQEQWNGYEDKAELLDDYNFNCDCEQCGREQVWLNFENQCRDCRQYRDYRKAQEQRDN